MLEALLGQRGAPAAPAEFVLIPPEDFITATALSTLVGMDGKLRIGTVAPAGDTTPWMLFRDGVNIFVIPQKALRQDIFWSALQGTINGTLQVTIAGCQWKILLMKGLNVATSQWNKYMHGVTAGMNPAKRWASFTNEELGMGTWKTANCFIQEMYNQYQTYSRGALNSVGSGPYNNNKDDVSAAWRPILQYVSGELPW